MGNEIKRKLASIQRIEEIRDIENADAIQAYRVLGWWVVDKKDAHKVGDLVVYLSLDSWVPHELAPFLSKGNDPREYNGVKGERLRTVKLRGQVSQGLLLKTEEYNYSLDSCLLPFVAVEEDGNDGYPLVKLGDDITDMLGVQKWEPPISPQLAGQVRGVFPTSLIPKTDQERIQNCFGEIQKRAKRFLTEKVWNAETQTLEEHPVVIPEGFEEPTYEVTMKLDGSSCTIFRWEDELRVCSRNMELKINDENADNAFVAMALKFSESIPNGFAFQGEIWGESIQGNKEGIKGKRFSVFDIFDIQKHEYLSPIKRCEMLEDLRALSSVAPVHNGKQSFEVPDHVPVLGTGWKAPESIEDGLKLASGPSIHAKQREGIVWKCNEDPNFSFKIISNEWLLKHGE